MVEKYLIKAYAEQRMLKNMKAGAVAADGQASPSKANARTKAKADHLLHSVASTSKEQAAAGLVTGLDILLSSMDEIEESLMTIQSRATMGLHNLGTMRAVANRVRTRLERFREDSRGNEAAESLT
jgi:hypothetical protein